VQNLLIMIFAEEGQYAFTRHGGPYDKVTLKETPDDLVLIKQALAEPAIWKQAVDNAGALFGITLSSSLRTASNQNALQREVHSAVAKHKEPCRSLKTVLGAQLQALGMSGDGNRMRNAELAVDLLTALAEKEGPALCEELANVAPVTNMPALARSIASASRVVNAIEDNNWALLIKVWARPDGESQSIKRRVHEALESDELVTNLAEALKQAQLEATQLIDTTPPQPQPPQPPVTPPEPPRPPRGRRIIRQDAKQGLDAHQAKRVLDDIQSGLAPGVTLDISYTIVGEE
jgi:hypothetical protein